ncbi:MAG: cytidine deaminase [Erysipelotrichaceae bacterium]|jgi:cytidine deaminase|nr:cytidine deaminase [Erysipelotrichaceae bacterium]
MFNGNEKESLLKLAQAAQKRSYSPYSAFPVGAVLLTEKGKTYLGTNIENISYGLSMCAERVAIFNYLANGDKSDKIKALMIIGNTEEPIAPCGACRQVIAEFFSGSENIYLVSGKEKIRTVKAKELLPFAFNKLS